MTEENRFPRTDLATERRRADLSLPGTDFREVTEGRFTTTRITVGDEVSARAIGRPVGRYLTVAFPPLAELCEEESSLLRDILVREIRSVLPRVPARRVPTVLVAGLGNRAIVSDAVGPETVGRITATSHLAEHEPALFRALGCYAVATAAPGVLADTGLESVGMLAGICRSLRPDYVLLIDALAARSADRLMTTVQIADTGIRPGSGIGNERRAIDRAALGVPVVSVGVPTVVEAATLVSDCLDRAGVTEEARDAMIDRRDRFYVTPKDVDLSVARISRLLAEVFSTLFSLPREEL
ncbi:MAG: GPR endopeptidase [Clostridia bacterium]|nr:GPR endopeptidase [Clostridia bacterium]